MTDQTDISPVRGDRLRQLREDRGWSRFELRTRSGVSESTIVRAERSEPVSFQNVLQIAKALGVEVGEVYDNAPTPSSSFVHDEEPPEWFTQALEDQTRQILAAIDAQGRDLRARLPRR